MANTDEEMPDWLVCDLADKGFAEHAEAAAAIRGVKVKEPKEPKEQAVKGGASENTSQE